MLQHFSYPTTKKDENNDMTAPIYLNADHYRVEGMKGTAKKKREASEQARKIILYYSSNE